MVLGRERTDGPVTDLWDLLSRCRPESARGGLVHAQGRQREHLSSMYQAPFTG